MVKRTNLFLIVACLLGGEALAEQTTSGYLRIKQPDVRLPDGMVPGQYRRVIQPFENWTLICDENLRDNTRVCNITQSVVDQADRMVLSLSVVASEDGSPFLLMRTLPELGAEGVVTLSIPDGLEAVRIGISGCDASVCLGQLPIGPRFGSQIMQGGTVTVSYSTRSGENFEINAPLAGIDNALSAID